MSSGARPRIRGYLLLLAGVGGLCIVLYNLITPIAFVVPEHGNQTVTKEFNQRSGQTQKKHATEEHGDHTVTKEFNWRRITGRVVSLDAPEPFPSLKHPSGGLIVDQSLVVSDANHGLANVVVLISGSLLPGTNSRNDRMAEVPILKITELGISPRYLIVQNGNLIRVQNTTKAKLELTFYCGRSEDHLVIPAQASTQWTPPQKPTPIQVGVSARAWMAAFIIPIAEDGMAVLTDADGCFSVEIPEGRDAKLQFWHERTGFIAGRDVDPANRLPRGTPWESRTLMIHSEPAGDIALNEIQIPGSRLEVEISE